MNLVQVLSQKQKPLTTCLVDGGGNYRPEAVVEAVNFARAYGKAQLLASISPNCGDDCYVFLRTCLTRMTQEISLLSESSGEFKPIIETAMQPIATILLQTKSSVAEAK